MAKNKITVKLTKARDTPGTYVYKSNEDKTPVPSLYIKKTAFSGDAPESITLTIEEN